MPFARPVLYLSHKPAASRISALEFGRVDDGQPPGCWERVGSRLGLLHDGPDGNCVGFSIVDLDGYNPDDEAHADLWDTPRFDVPALGFTDVAPNTIVVVTRALFGDEPVINRVLFRTAVNSCGDLGLRNWRGCLQAGDSMGHFGLGYALYGLGRVTPRLPASASPLRHRARRAMGVGAVRAGRCRSR